MIKFYPQKIQHLFFLVLTAVCCTTCETDMDLNGPSNNHYSTVDLITRVTASTVSGFVTDENESPVQSASVQVGNTTLSTDKYGYFEVKNISVVQNAATVTVVKQNYFKAIKTFIAVEGKGAFFRIKLLPKTVAGTINAAAGGAVTLSTGLIISIPANAIVNAANNQSYSGSVNVMARLISADDADLDRIMPGDLRGINSSNGLTLLTTYGMAAVELIGSGGESLQIITGKKATLTIPIPTTLLANAPASIPLWYFDESNGLWKEEGSAAKTGNAYVGQVAHFSFWNCDQPGNQVQFNCTLVGPNAQPLPWMRVKISYVSNPLNNRWGTTDYTGYVNGAVPANAALKMEVFAGDACTSIPLYAQTFNTTNTNISLGTIMVNAPAFIAVVTGTATNCTNAPLDPGVVMLRSGNQFYYCPVVNGNYAFNFPICSSPAPVSISISDITTHQESLPMTYVLNAGNNTIPNIQACGTTAAEFFYYTFNGNPEYLAAGPGFSFTHRPVILTNPPGQGDELAGGDPARVIPPARIVFEHPASLPASSGRLVYFNRFSVSYEGGAPFPNPINILFTEYGNVGQYIAGNFAGTVKSNVTNNVYTVTCSFRVKRAF